MEESPLKRWKMTAVDRRAQELWEEYTRYKEKMFQVTDTEISPWFIIDANKKSAARMEAIKHVLKRLPYQ
jgi:polyphosphate kinase 2 (PPK2 family)